jgi:putative tricarboxylic transport membrane protein
MIGLFVRLLYIPIGILLPVVLVLSAIGIFAINNSTGDLYLCLLFGIVGYVFRKIDIPLAPLVLAVVLGEIMEQSFRQAMTISGGELSIFIGSPITIGLCATGVFILGYTLFKSTSRKRSKYINAAEAGL